MTASAWINDLKNQIEQTRIFSTVYRSATALGSRLPSIATAKAKVAGAGAILRPVSNGTQVLFLSIVCINKISVVGNPKLCSIPYFSHGLEEIYNCICPLPWRELLLTTLSCSYEFKKLKVYILQILLS